MSSSLNLQTSKYFYRTGEKNFKELYNNQVRSVSDIEVIPCQNALEKSGCKHNLKYQGSITTSNKKEQQKRNIIQ